MTFIPFGGFFNAAMFIAEEEALQGAHWAAMLEKYPQYYVRMGILSAEGHQQIDVDVSFRKEHYSVAQKLRTLQKQSFRGQKLDKPGVVLKIQATPGSRLYSLHGDTVRTYVLGGTVGDDVAYMHNDDISWDDVVVSYMDLQSFLSAK